METEDLLPKEKKVFVRLRAACWIDNEIRQAGEAVELPEVFAKDAGDIVKVKDGPTNDDK